MQRTVHYTKFTYAEFTEENGNFLPLFKQVTVADQDEKRALRKAFKIVRMPFNPVKVETGTKLYVLDDEIFFRYAREIAPEEAEEDDAGE